MVEGEAARRKSDEVTIDLVDVEGAALLIRCRSRVGARAVNSSPLPYITLHFKEGHALYQNCLTCGPRATRDSFPYHGACARLPPLFQLVS